MADGKPDISGHWLFPQHPGYVGNIAADLDPADMRGVPPAILTTGTRDLLLSSTVRVHRKLRQAGVEAALQVFEGQSHAHYNRDPETKEAFDEIAQFLDKHLGK